MSLINQVLLDLDQRHAPAGVLPLARGVLPQRRSVSLVRWTGALFAVAAGAVIVVATSRATPSLPTSPAVVAATAPRAVVPPTQNTPLMPIIPTAAAAPIAIVVSAASPMPAASIVAPAIVASSDAPAKTIKPAAPAKAIETTPPAKVAMLTAPAATSRRAVTTPTAVAPPAIAPDASVEKRVRPLSARERADAEYQRGLGLHQQGQAEEARRAFAAALREDARHAPARQALAVALLADGRADEAETVLSQGLELQPREAQLASTLARIKADHHDIAGAIGVLKAALPAGAGTKADAPETRALLATLQQRNAEHAEAIENYAAALRLVPGNGPWWIGLGVSLAATGRSENAREAFERARATELTPDLARYVEQRLASSPR